VSSYYTPTKSTSTCTYVANENTHRNSVGAKLISSEYCGCLRVVDNYGLLACLANAELGGVTRLVIKLGLCHHPH